MTESDVQPEGEPVWYEHRIRKGDEIVGGVYKLKYPASNWADYWTWVENLKVPEERFLMHLEPRGQFFGEPYSMSAFYGKEGKEETAHYFYNADTCVYDLWFNTELLSENEKMDILNSVEFEKTTWDGSLALALPDGYDFSRDIQGNLIFTDGLNQVGGRYIYRIPDGYTQNGYVSQEFLMDLGIPEASNETLGYSGGGSLLGAAGYGIEYFSDVPPGQTRAVHTYHQFFMMSDGVTLYDIWLDLRFVDNAVKDSIINSIEIPDIGRETAQQEEATVAVTVNVEKLENQTVSLKKEQIELLNVADGRKASFLTKGVVEKVIINATMKLISKLLLFIKIPFSLK